MIDVTRARLPGIRVKHLVSIPLIAAITVASLFFIFHIGIGSISIPEWYVETPGKPAPINSFITYWINKSITNGILTFFITYIPLAFIYWRSNLSRKNV
ncbi:MAG TPA: hypothetical protein DCR24_07395 [Bacillus bacterium]|nr:hypothetical protein [Bacillus sp. (in: firmicutes)]